MSTPMSTDKPAPRTAARRFAPVDLFTSLLLVFPLFLVYQLGVLALPSVYNGADLITASMLRLLHGQVRYYLLVQGGLFVLFVGAVLVLRKKNQFNRRLVWRVLGESTLYALLMGSLIVFVMMNLLHIDPRLAVGDPAAAPTPAADQGFVSRLVLSIGAGVHEELLFRLIGLSALVALLHKLIGMRRGLAILIGFLVSSVLFSAAHHIIGGEPWRIGVFVYRTFCGLFFATLFWTRGFAIAVYTHALYDIYVLVVR